ncbi:MAG TPA: T9SS type A sorting domain-containing protein [Cyclobacteriaceae bacterium]|nr:T9SS type A sorting domain-containing protein [Cyclobacteriaceae bacterium]
MKSLFSFFAVVLLLLHLNAEAQVRVLNEAVEFNGRVNTSQRKSLILQNESDQHKEYILKFMRGNIASSQNIKICLNNTCYDPKKDLAKVKLSLAPGEVYTDLYLEFELGITSAKGTFDLHFANTQNLRDIFIVEGVYNVENPESGGNEVDNKDIKLGSVYPNPASRVAQLEYEIKNPAINARIVVNSIIGNPVYDLKLNPKDKSVFINVADLDSGIYFYTLIVDNKNIVTKKFVVKR